MIGEAPDELKTELKTLGFRRAHRHQLLAIQLLTYDIEKHVVIEKLLDKGVSRDLAEWFVFSVREEVENVREREREFEHEPPLFEVVAKLLVCTLCLVLVAEIGYGIQRLNSLDLTILTVPWLMIGGAIVVVFWLVNVHDLLESIRSRRFMK